MSPSSSVGLPSIHPRAGLAGRLAFDNYDDIYVADLPTGRIDQLTAAEGRDFNAAWAPDGRRIAFRSRRDGNDEIYVMNDDGTGQRNLTQTPDRAEWGPSWSPDGTQIAFNAETGGHPSLAVFSIRLDGTGLRRVTASFGEFPAWSPDGTQIAFASMAAGSTGLNPNYDIRVVDLDTSGERNLTATTGRYEIYPQWSPDGRRLAFMGGPVGMEATRVLVMDSDGSDVRELTTGNTGFPTWSPDGRHIAFVKVGRDISIITAQGAPIGDLGLRPFGEELGFPAWTE